MIGKPFSYGEIQSYKMHVAHSAVAFIFAEFESREKYKLTKAFSEIFVFMVYGFTRINLTRVS